MLFNFACVLHVFPFKIMRRTAGGCATFMHFHRFLLVSSFLACPALCTTSVSSSRRASVFPVEPPSFDALESQEGWAASSWDDVQAYESVDFDDFEDGNELVFSKQEPILDASDSDDDEGFSGWGRVERGQPQAPMPVRKILPSSTSRDLRREARKYSATIKRNQLAAKHNERALRAQQAADPEFQTKNAMNRAAFQAYIEGDYDLYHHIASRYRDKFSSRSASGQKRTRSGRRRPSAGTD